MVAYCIHLRQYLSNATSQSFSISAGLSASLVSLCVTWQGANLVPYLRPQVRSHSLLHKHLICHRCQSEQIRLPTAESARNALLLLLLPSPPPTLLPYMFITNTRKTHLPRPAALFTRLTYMREYTYKLQSHKKKPSTLAFGGHLCT